MAYGYVRKEMAAGYDSSDKPESVSSFSFAYP